MPFYHASHLLKSSPIKSDLFFKRRDFMPFLGSHHYTLTGDQKHRYEISELLGNFLKMNLNVCIHFLTVINAEEKVESKSLLWDKSRLWTIKARRDYKLEKIILTGALVYCTLIFITYK